MKEFYTPPEFAKEFGYNEEYVRMMCRNQCVHGKRVSLPDGWTATKMLRDWVIWPPAEINRFRLQRLNAKLRRKYSQRRLRAMARSVVSRFGA